MIPYETDEITRLIIDQHDPEAFKKVSSYTVGEFRDWLLTDDVSTEVLQHQYLMDFAMAAVMR